MSVLGDKTQLWSLLANLLGNVRMHTSPATPCRVEVCATGNGEVLVRVEDKGPGIQEAAVAHVFDRFYRADKGRSRASGGSGLGLSIVAAVTELHGGRVASPASPAAGPGSTSCCPCRPSHRSRLSRLSVRSKSSVQDA